MNGNDLFRGMNYVNLKYIEEAETVLQLREQRRISLRKAVWIAAVITMLAATITACAFAIRRIRMELVQHNIPASTETSEFAVQTGEMDTGKVLTDCYPQAVPEGYELLCSSPMNYHSRSIQYRNSEGNSIVFRISTEKSEETVPLRPPVEESVVTVSGVDAALRTNEGAQILEWTNEAYGYFASLFTDDLTVDLAAMAQSVERGTSIPASVWYHRGREWNPWYPQELPEGYSAMEVSPVSNGYQCLTYTNGKNAIRYGVSTVEDLAPVQIGEEDYWEEVQVNGNRARMLRNQSVQRTLFWQNPEEGFYAFLETMDETVDLIAMAEHVGVGEKLEVSKSYLGPDYTIELEQEQTVYMQWQSVYPQNIPEGYELDTVGDRAYGQQTIIWKNSRAETIAYTLYFRLGQYGREFEGTGQPETVSINGHTGYLARNRLLWADEELGFAYELVSTGSADLLAIAESVAPGPELPFTNDTTAEALKQLGDYQITELPANVVEDGLSGAPLEDADDWYSYVRRWYYDRTNNDQVYFTYETYLTDCSTEEDVLRLFVSGAAEPEFMTIHGHPGITLQDGDSAYVAWMDGGPDKGTSFQLTSQQFTVEELLTMARSVHRK